jgi:hypothetical protein
MLARYSAAKENAASRGMTAEFDRLQELLESSIATLNLYLRVADNLSRGQPYGSYYDAITEELRGIAKRDFHADRTKVDAEIHTGYVGKIVNLALSPDGRALPNYGEVALLLKQGSVSDRCSVLRENAFTFHKTFGLGDVGVHEPLGWRSVWEDRVKLGAAALEPGLKSGMSDEELERLIITAKPTRFEDHYIELHLYGTVVREYVGGFYLAEPLPDTGEETIWRGISERLTEHGAQLVEVPDV